MDKISSKFWQQDEKFLKNKTTIVIMRNKKKYNIK